MHRAYIALVIICIVAGCKSTSHVAKTEHASQAYIESKPSPADTSKPKQIIDLPVFIPIAQLQLQLYKLYFQPTDGKFYPCAGHSDCSELYKDLYVENPVLKVDGELVSIKLHVDGNANAIVFHPEVSGDILLTAKPVVKNDTLFFQNVKMEKSSQGFLLHIASSLFEKRIISKLQDNAWYSFRPTIDKYTQDFQKLMPLKWETSVLLVSLKKIYLNSVCTLEAPTEGILADFSAELTTEKATFGQ
ncbi:MAG TPA: DUF4403 family protein [Bacteroidia bacterium]|jgi:hypothetical protein|nr:DUF4403 family protein [Bacteroidia bacterium]